MRSVAGVSAIAEVYAAWAAVCAALAALSPACLVPVSVPGGKPVMAVPGDTPILPVQTVLPVLVTVVAPRAQYPAATPRLILGMAAAASADWGSAIERVGRARAQARRN